MAFESLTDKLSAVFKRLRGKGRLSEADVKEAMREIRLALLEADVSFKVVKQFVAQVTEKAVGSDVLEALSPAQQIVKIVNQELTALMGGGAWATHGLVSRVLSGHSAYGANAIATLCGILAGVIVYAILVVALRILRAEDLKTVPHGAKLAKLLHLR